MATVSSIEGIRLSPLQRRLWQLVGDARPVPYGCRCTVRIVGSLDEQLLRDVLTQVVDRNELLRTGFQRLPEMSLPLQVIAEQGRYELGPAQAREVAQEYDFDLEAGPLLRVGLSAATEGEHLLTLELPAFCADPAGLVNLVREIACCYAARQAGEPEPEEPIQYAELSEWQNELFDDGEAPGLEDWRQRMADGPSPRKLAWEELGSDAGAGFLPARSSCSMAPDVVERIEACAESLGVEIEAVLLGGWAAALGRLSENEGEIVVGTVFDGRAYEELEDALGPFAQHLPVRVEVTPGEAFDVLVKKVQGVLRECAESQECFSWESAVSGDGEGGAAFFPFCFEHREPPREITCSGLSWKIEQLHWRADRFALELLSHHRGGESLELEMHYDGERYSRKEAERILGHLQVLLNGACAAPATQIGRLPMLNDAQRWRALGELNDSAVSREALQAVHRAFSTRAAESPNRPAVVLEGAELDYASLEANSNRLARHLRQLGVGPEVGVGLRLERSVELVTAMLAVLKAGGYYVSLDPELPAQRVDHMLATASVRALVTVTELTPESPLGDLETVLLDADAEAIARHAATCPEDLARPENLAYVLFTSGSTGRPKGVGVEHRQLAAYTQAARQRLRFPEAAHFGMVSTFAADLGNTMVFPALCGGGTLHVLAQDRLSDPEALADYAERRPLDCLKVVPSHLQALLSGSRPQAVLPRRVLVLGGEALPAALAEQVAGLAPDCALYNHYGPTETTVGVLAHRVSRGPTSSGTPTIPLGRPLAGSRVYPLDAYGAPAVPGTAGEAHLGGLGVARGYVGQPALTAARFVPDPFAGMAGGRCYRSGDLVRQLDDGTLLFVGRVDHQIKVRGFRIEPGEIEAVLREQPSVQSALVRMRQDGTGAERLVAYVVTERGSSPASEDLLEALRRRLPAFMVPGALVTLPALPLTANGKVDLAALPVPDRNAAAEHGFVAPLNDAEKALARIWCEVLDLERVGIHDNFFALGGDSILSIRVVSLANRAGLRLTPRQFFQHQTIAELVSIALDAAALGAGTEARAEQPEAEVAGALPLTPIQHWLFEQQLQSPHHFNQSLLLELEPGLELAALERATELLMEHHDALRLRFSDDGGEVTQRYASPGEVPWSRIDLTRLSPAAGGAAQEVALAQLQGSLSLLVGPLARVAAFERPADERDRLAMIVHHLAVDAVSWQILVEDLGALHRQLQAGESPRLPAKTTSFKAWGERLVEHARSSGIRAELDFWRELGAEGWRALPVDFEEAGARELNTVGSSQGVMASLSLEETRSLLHEVPDAYRTRIDDVLLTALARALVRFQGGGPAWIELEGHGREAIFDDVDLSRTVGWFTTRFPVALAVSGSQPVGDALKSIKEQLRAVPGRGLGFGLLRYLSGDPEVHEVIEAVRPAEVSFNYLGRLDTAQVRAVPFALAADPMGPERHPRNRRRYLLEVNGRVHDGRLQVEFRYSERLHRRSTVESLAADFAAALRQLIEHCLSPEAGGRTPHDFPLARLDQATLDRLIGGRRDVEDVYPLSPLQEGMLFHSFYAAGSGTYISPMSCTLEGTVDESALDQAWQRVTDRHPVLRTAFAWEGLPRPVQMVYREVSLPWQRLDWRRLSPAEQRQRRSELIEEQRREGFALDRPPLMRLTLIRTGEDRYDLIWTRHHLLVDGWTTSLILEEVFAAYSAFAAGAADSPAPSRPYRDYIAWLEDRDRGADADFWHRALAGMAEPTPLPVPPEAGGPAGQASAGEQERALSPALTQALNEMARRHHLTVNTLLQGAWAVLLGHFAGRGDVTFGNVVSGRPTDLTGFDRIVGMFINTLPVRVELAADQPLVSWLRQLQDQLAEQRQFEHSPLVEIHGWSDVPREQRLFETIVVFENYPQALTAKARADETAELVVRDIEHSIRNSYALTLRPMPGARLTLDVLFDAGRLREDAVVGLLDRLEILLTAMTEAPEEPLRSLSEALTAEDERRMSARHRDYDQALQQSFQRTRRRAVKTQPIGES